MMIRRAILVVTCWSVVLTSPLKPYSSQEDEKPCSDVLSEGFDFLRTAGLDSLGSDLTGVTKVTGSNKNATAFSIGPEASLRMPTRSIFPKGVPDEFSFAAVLRLKERSTVDMWEPIRIEDSEGNSQFGILVDGLKNEIEYYMPDISGGILAMTFSSDLPLVAELFDGKWHKLELSITRDNLELYVDCQLVATEDLDERDSIDLDGEIAIAAKEDGTSATIDLQWLMMHCDPMKPKNGRCYDIDGIRTTTTQPTKPTITTKRTTPKPTTTRPPTTTGNEPEKSTPEPTEREPEPPAPRRPLDNYDLFYGYGDVYDTADKREPEPPVPRRPLDDFEYNYGSDYDDERNVEPYSNNGRDPFSLYSYHRRKCFG